jgi:hypothetical protein
MVMFLVGMRNSINLEYEGIDRKPAAQNYQLRWRRSILWQESAVVWHCIRDGFMSVTGLSKLHHHRTFVKVETSEF